MSKVELLDKVYPKSAEDLRTMYNLEQIGLVSDSTQSDWNQTDSAKADYIKNKPNLSFQIPTKTSDLSNDSGFITIASVPQPISAVQITILQTSWNELTAQVSLANIGSQSNVLVFPLVDSQEAYVCARVYCFGQASGSLSFCAQSVPQQDLNVGVVIL